MILETDRKAIEWTPNTISSELRIEGQVAYIHLTSDTPNFREYQVKTSPDSNWQKVEDEFTLELTDSSYEIAFRAVNIVNVSGPEHHVKIETN